MNKLCGLISVALINNCKGSKKVPFDDYRQTGLTIRGCSLSLH